MFSFQDDAVDWMKIRELDTNVPGGFLCHEMGLGKTRMMCRLIKENLRNVTLVLTTRSTLHGWLDELREQSKFRFDVLEFNAGKIVPELERIPERPCVVVGTHQSVFNTFPLAVDRLVIDEGHAIRNRAGKLYKSVTNIPARYRWLMTATPYNNGSSDIGSYTEFLKPGLPARAFRHYALRKTRKDIYPDGPTIKVSKYVYDFETEEEKRLYEFVEGQIDNVEEWIQHNRGRVPRHVLNTIGFGLMIRKRQAAIHPQIVLDAEKKWRETLDEEEPVDTWKTNVTKFKHILEMVKKDQAQRKNTMIVTHFQRELDLLRETLTTAGIRVEVLNGHTTPEERRALEKRMCDTDIVHALLETRISCVAGLVSSFVSPPTVLLLQIRAGGVGLSLPWVHHVINTSPDWNPFLEVQAMYRAYRITTQHDVHVTNMYFRKTIDMRIQDQQTRKLVESLHWTGDSEDTITDFISMPIV